MKQNGSNISYISESRGCTEQIQERKAERAFESLNYASNIYGAWKIPVSWSYPAENKLRYY
jgi:hypothetical protein